MNGEDVNRGSSIVNAYGFGLVTYGLLLTATASRNAKHAYIRMLVQMFLSMKKLIFYLFLLLTVLACRQSGKENAANVMDFGSFTIQAPAHWHRMILHGIDSYVGAIVIDSTDTLMFDLGWYSNDLAEYQEVIMNDGRTYYISNSDTAYNPTLFDSANRDKVEKSKISWDTIDGRRAKILSPIKPGVGITGIYIDSLWKSGPDHDRFNLYGTNLKPVNEKAVLEALGTLKFKKPG